MIKKQTPNDQQHIIDALAVCDYMYVWEKVKYVGYKKVADLNERYMIFCDIVDEFRYEENNNFIHFYLQRLTFYSASKNETYFVPLSRGVINRLKREYISPTDCEESKIAKDLRNWNNY
jgi:hypothetical protein